GARASYDAQCNLRLHARASKDDGHRNCSSILCRIAGAVALRGSRGRKKPREHLRVTEIFDVFAAATRWVNLIENALALQRPAQSLDGAVERNLKGADDRASCLRSFLERHLAQLQELDGG